MKTRFDGIKQIYRTAYSELMNELGEGKSINIFDFSEDWEDDDEKYDQHFNLPQQPLFDDYFYNIYFLHTVYKENGKIFAIGYATEIDEVYHFNTDEIMMQEFVHLVDIVMNKIGK